MEAFFLPLQPGPAHGDTHIATLFTTAQVQNFKNGYLIKTQTGDNDDTPKEIIICHWLFLSLLFLGGF